MESRPVNGGADGTARRAIRPCDVVASYTLLGPSPNGLGSAESSFQAVSTLENGCGRHLGPA